MRESKKKKPASAGSRTRVNCLEGSYANRYTTDASDSEVSDSIWSIHKNSLNSVSHDHGPAGESTMACRRGNSSDCDHQWDGVLLPSPRNLTATHHSEVPLNTVKENLHAFYILVYKEKVL
ncbi:hypothetical protein AVEN_204318-1 [Araneus ventricosus]|uniref:Uncharacterized protein n=1 Tax=Araneus ventricosus TaxID=182803 RepID=A0A4Y2WW46_ARAVE|nr:hypothetical protein AVEN_204318-1 [Araneus ventricosus]